MLINDWDNSVFNKGLTNGTNIIKADNYRNWKMKQRGNTELIVVGMIGEGINRSYGSYDSHYIRYPIVIEAHSYRSDNLAEAWIEEIRDIIEGRRKNMSDLYADYRKIIMDQAPSDKSAGTKFKWIMTIYLETHVQCYPAQTYDGGGALDGMPKEILDGGSA